MELGTTVYMCSGPGIRDWPRTHGTWDHVSKTFGDMCSTKKQPTISSTLALVGYFVFQLILGARESDI